MGLAEIIQEMMPLIPAIAVFLLVLIVMFFDDICEVLETVWTRIFS